VSDGAVNLNSAGIHILEYADVVAKGTACGVLTCFTQSGWGFGTVGNAHSGPYQRPYYERNDVYGYLPYFDTNVGVRCCAQNDGNNTSSFWAGTYDIDNNLKFQSYFNNEVGSGNVELGYSFLPGLVSADLTGEEDYNSVGTLPSVGPVTFAEAELDVAHPDSWIPWTTSYPGEVDQDTAYYPFSTMIHYTGFKYSGP
jgi:hypothetical protein